MIDAALAHGHEVTLFNRGTTDADLYPELERITGDRDGGLDGLRGREWDAVVDTSGYLPRIVGAAPSSSRAAVGHYVFVSSISVYASFAEVVDEDSPRRASSPSRAPRTSRRTTGRSRRSARRRSRARSPGARRPSGPG